MFKFELYRIRRSTAIWVGSLIFLTAIFMSLYPLFQSSAEEFKEILSQYPPNILKALGSSMDVFTSKGGFIAYYVSIYVSMAIFVFALIRGIRAASFDFTKRTHEIIFTLPKSRNQIFSAFILANYMSLVLVLLASLLTMICITLLTPENVSREIVNIYTGMLLTSTFLYTLGLCIGVVLRKVKSPVLVSSCIIFGLFLIKTLAQILEIDFLNYLSPLSYFEPGAVYITDIDFQKALIAAAVIIILTATSYYAYKTNDL